MKTRLIGGEMELPPGLFSALTDSGRSSLRLLLQSETLRSRRFLLPDFLCGSVTAVFDALGISYGFYPVGADFSLDPGLAGRNDFQALYVIDYFGCRPDLSALAGKDLAVVEDAVFLPWPEARPEFPLWAGFNSFRKITTAPDGSVVRATFELLVTQIEFDQAPYSIFKSRARHLKHAFLAGSEENGIEEEYLRLFREGEAMLDEQTGIYRISDTAILALMDFRRDSSRLATAAARNLRLLQRLLPEWAVPLEPEFPSFQPLLVPDRDRLRQALAMQRVFLPVHWPAPAETDHPLYGRIISVPVDARYRLEDMAAVAGLIRSSLKPV